ncbi:hypothetical protein [Cryobacterium adonitolivorans]|nr:hypothetical protein [Cryobacterium adonitolivorans]
MAIDATTTVAAASIVHDAHHALEHALPNLDDFLIAQQSHRER